jgi:spore coat-associated protein N
MKNITKSLLMITAVAALAIGGTVAYFSDTETSTGNTFTTGTVDINVNGSSWSQQSPYAIKDMKPGYTDYINFKINNTGTNPANVWKKLSSMVTTKIISGTAVDLKDQIVYDLSVKVYGPSTDPNPIWFQTIYTAADLKTLADVYGSTDGHGVLLGMIPAGGHMDVVQSYHMKEAAGNEYQGETMTFNMDLYAEQLINTVTMVKKTGGDWDDIDQSSTAKAVLSYNAKADQFKYDLTVNGLTASTNYVLVSGSNPYNGSDTVQLATFTTDGSGAYSVTGQVIDVNKDLKNAKVWVIPASDWNGSTMTGWHGASYLFETALVDYTDPIK